MAEQTPTARTLDYSLSGDTLDRVKGATTATAKKELQTLKGKTDFVDTITTTTRQIGASVIAGAAQTKELNGMWDAAISRDTYGTVELRDELKNLVRPDQEAYIKAVREGNKDEQERLLAELGEKANQLTATKASVESLTDTYNNIGFKDNLNSFSLADQTAAAVLANGKKVSYIRSDDGQLISQINQTQEVIDDIHSGLEQGANELDAVFAERKKKHEEDYLDNLMNGEHIGEYIVTDKNGVPLADGTSPGAQLSAADLASGKIIIKRNFNAANIDKLGANGRKPVEITRDVTAMLAKVQQDASDPKSSTYFDYANINNSVLAGITPESINDFMYEDIGAGSTFAKDFLFNPALDIPVFIKDDPRDANKDGVLSPDETKGYNMTPEDKKLILKALADPENAEIAKHHIGDWLTMKSYEKWKAGTQQRQITNTQTGVVTQTPADLTNNEKGDKSPYGKYYNAGDGVVGTSMASANLALSKQGPR